MIQCSDGNNGKKMEQKFSMEYNFMCHLLNETDPVGFALNLQYKSVTWLCS